MVASILDQKILENVLHAKILTLQLHVNQTRLGLRLHANVVSLTNLARNIVSLFISAM